MGWGWWNHCHYIDGLRWCDRPEADVAWHHTHHAREDTGVRGVLDTYVRYAECVLLAAISHSTVTPKLRVIRRSSRCRMAIAIPTMMIFDCGVVNACVYVCAGRVV